MVKEYMYLLSKFRDLSNEMVEVLNDKFIAENSSKVNEDKEYFERIDQQIMYIKISIQYLEELISSFEDDFDIELMNLLRLDKKLGRSPQEG